jgi:hypothetical protein
MQFSLRAQTTGASLGSAPCRIQPRAGASTPEILTSQPQRTHIPLAQRCEPRRTLKRPPKEPLNDELHTSSLRSDLSVASVLFLGKPVCSPEHVLLLSARHCPITPMLDRVREHCSQSISCRTWTSEDFWPGSKIEILNRHPASRLAMFRGCHESDLTLRETLWKEI